MKKSLVAQLVAPKLPPVPVPIVPPVCAAAVEGSTSATASAAAGKTSQVRSIGRHITARSVPRPVADGGRVISGRRGDRRCPDDPREMV